MDKKKFLFISWDGNITDVAWHVSEQGHDVKYYIREKTEKEVGDGFIEKIDDWRKEVDWADVIVFDDVMGMGTLADDLRKRGKAVVGGTPYTDKLENDRSFGQEELKKYGINIIPYRDFTSFNDAITFVKENPAKYVIKPSGKAGNYKGLLFVGEEEDGRDVIEVLDDYKEAWEKKITQFQLQKRVNGVEIAVGAFFNGKKFIEPINVNFEYKKLFPGNLGPSTGEMGTTMFWSKSNKIFNQTLKKFETKLAEEGYAGYIDINCIVNNRGIYPLEFTSRFGYPTINIQQDGMITPVSELLYNLANGIDFDFKTKTGFQIGVVIVVPPFPYNDKETFNVKSKESVIFFKKPVEGVHIQDVKKINNQWVVSGSIGYALIVCGEGQSVKQAQKNVYSKIKNILIPHMYYRNDIGERWIEDADKLHNWGYLRES